MVWGKHCASAVRVVRPAPVATTNQLFFCHDASVVEVEHVEHNIHLVLNTPFTHDSQRGKQAAGVSAMSTTRNLSATNTQHLHIQARTVNAHCWT